MNDQRKVVFGQRREIMEATDLSEITTDMRSEVIEDLIYEFMPPNSYADQWNTEGLYAAAIERLGLDVPLMEWCAEEGVDDEQISERLMKATDEKMGEKAEAFGPETMRLIEKQLLLQSIDGKWREHLLTLEHLRSVVGFRGYAQRDPLNEYKNEAFQLFESMLDSLREDVTQKLSQIRPITDEEQRAIAEQATAQQAQVQASDKPSLPAPTAEAVSAGFDADDSATWGNPGRNGDCPCGSGKKFKHCHGRVS